MATIVQRNSVEEIRPTGLANTDLTFNIRYSNVKIK